MVWMSQTQSLRGRFQAITHIINAAADLLVTPADRDNSVNPAYFLGVMARDI
jgi:hypothetical protein